MTKLITAVALAFWFLAGLTVPDISSAMERPTREEIVKYKQDGTYAQRLERARQIGNDKTDPYTLWKTRRKVESLVLKEKGISGAEISDQLVTNAPPPAMKGLPTTGTVKIPMLLVDFPDYPHAAVQTVEDVDSKLFGSGNQSDYPYESLQKYYQRSSYNQLTISGNVLGWYRARYNRSYYENLGDRNGQDTLIKEALNYFNSKGHDFAQYDNDNDGNIDGIFIKWTGPDNGWSGFWWAYQYYFFDSSYSVDGKRLGKYVWSWYSREYAGGGYYDYSGYYRPQTDIHETGHMLGLPDYYDYDDRYGPGGGVGMLDMMDGNWGDHNCFSKFMLDWITPTVIASGEQFKNFSPSGASRDAALIMPQASGNVFNEYFMVQYRKRSTGNDPSDYPADGLLIWHVDATLNSSGNDFEYDNSYASHKLLALEQADGLGEIEYGGEADQGDFFLPPKTFGPGANPNSNSYSGSVTGVRVDNLGTPGAGMAARLSVSSSSTSGYGVSGRVINSAAASGVKSPSAKKSGELKVTESPVIQNAEVQATPISIGQTVSGSLNAGDAMNPYDWSYYDLYSFNATAGQKLAVSMESADFDTYLFLLNSAQHSIDQNDDSGGTTNSRIPGGSGYWTVPSSGTYYIMANSMFPGETGNYTLTLSSEGGGGSGTGIPGVTMNFSVLSGTGTAPAAVQTDSGGNWSQTGFAAGTMYRVTPGAPGYTFVPAYIDFSSAGTALNFNGTPGGGSPVTSVTLSADKTSPQPAGTTVTFTAAAGGSSNPYYQFWWQSPSGEWANSGAYSSNNTFQLTNTTAGSYKVIAYARDAVSSQQPVASNVLSFSFGSQGGGQVTSVTLAASPYSPQSAGTNVTFTATSAGSSSPIYQFWIMNPGGSWSSSGAYSANNTYQLTNTVAGTYKVVVYAMDAGSTQWEATTSLNYTFTGSGGHVTSVQLSTGASEPQPAGASVTFTATAAGGSSPLYQFWVMNPAGYWYSSGQYAPINTYVLNNTISGNYTILVFARDANAERWEAHDITVFKFN